MAAVRVQSATIVVNCLPSGSTDRVGQFCHSWPSEARNALSYAAGIWETLVSSAVPIEIDGCWANPGDGYLGYALAHYRRDFSGAPAHNTWYPLGLAKARSAMDLDPGDADMHVTANGGLGAAWSFGTDGNSFSRNTTSPEWCSKVAHGLGFAGSIDVSGARGIVGRGTGYAISYDRFPQDGGGSALMDTWVYGNPSMALASALPSNHVWFDGPHARAAEGGTRVKLYARSTWQPGSSYSHLDQIFNGTENALITYFINSGAQPRASGVGRSGGCRVGHGGCDARADGDVDRAGRGGEHGERGGGGDRERVREWGDAAAAAVGSAGPCGQRGDGECVADHGDTRFDGAGGGVVGRGGDESGCGDWDVGRGLTGTVPFARRRTGPGPKSP